MYPMRQQVALKSNDTKKKIIRLMKEKRDKKK